jgi:hypothetical protein
MTTPSSDSGSAPTSEQILSALSRLDPKEDLRDASLLWVVVVGSWADGEWRTGDDVDLRAVYAFAPEQYLGLTSFWDEFECLRLEDGWSLDLVAFEIEKASRLILKGHHPTLAWLGRDDGVLVSTPEGQRLAELARSRLAGLGRVDEKPPQAEPSLYRDLDVLVRDARLGRQRVDG